MRLTEKENETLPIDVSVSEPSIHLTRLHFTKTGWEFLHVFADRTTDIIVVYDDLLWHRQHRRRVQRYGRLIRIKNQVGSFVQQCDFHPTPQGKYKQGIFCIGRDSSLKSFTS